MEALFEAVQGIRVSVCALNAEDVPFVWMKLKDPPPDRPEPWFSRSNANGGREYSVDSWPGGEYDLAIVTHSGRPFYGYVTIREGHARTAQIDVSGKVTSRLPPQGALRSCPVRLIDSKGAETTTTTDVDGFYTFRDMAPGDCEITAGASGHKFIPETQDVTLRRGADAKVDFRVEVIEGAPK